MRASGWHLGVLAALFLLPPAAAVGQRADRTVGGNGAPGQVDEIVLSPGDSVRLVVWRKPELSGEFAVGPDGSLLHPLYRGVRVGGVPLAIAEANLRGYLRRLEADPQFVVEPRFQVAVEGEVHRPGLYAVWPGTSVAAAVARAGGPTEFAKRNRVRLLRAEGGAPREWAVDLTSPAAATAAMPVRSGDRIFVERRRATFREVVLPTLSVVGTIASVGILIERLSR
ncbi:MAG TPA: SLBB domain-containing protein [Gemmatimonadales bacterium]|nr:SLBB domain-containing protein [Gemmatimonadales bacterium]